MAKVTAIKALTNYFNSGEGKRVNTAGSMTSPWNNSIDSYIRVG